MKKELSRNIKALALDHGFYACGIARADELTDDVTRLRNWLDEHKHADMLYMENYFDKRTDPRKLIEGAKSVIVLLYNYFPEQQLSEESGYKISTYAYGTDYHFVIKEKLKKLMLEITAIAPDFAGCGFVDSAPVLERSWANRAGLGWIGKNTCLITKNQGSWFFISEIITTLELEYNEPFQANHCGGCTRCIDACPTEALDKNGLDARKCISYWTIENKSEFIPETFQGTFDNWIFGCDICQQVCPWNRLSEPHQEPAFRLSDHLIKIKKENWENLTEEKFKEFFQKSPLQRTKFSGLKRNIRFILDS